MTTKMHSKGTKIGVDTAGLTTFVDIGDVVKVKPWGKKRRTAKTTVLQSSQAYAEKIPGWKEGDNLTFTIRLVQAQYVTLDTAFEADVICNWQVTFPKIGAQTTGATFTSLGILTDLQITEGGVDSDAPFDVDITVEITGQPVFASGS